MAKLSDIAIYFDFHVHSPESHERKCLFNDVAIPATEIFLSFMQRHLVDGRSRLNIFLNRSTEKHMLYKPEPARMGSISNYHLGGFDWPAYFSADMRSRGVMVVDVIESALVDICSRCGVDPSPYKLAAQRTRDTGFVLEREIKVLSRSTRDRKPRFSVRRTLKCGENESWRVELLGRADGTSRCFPIADDIMSIAARYEFRHGCIDGDTFSILDYQRQPVFVLGRDGNVELPFIENRYSTASDDD